MDILSKTDNEIFELAKPIWDNLVKSSNLRDYGGFTKDFSTQMLFGDNHNSCDLLIWNGTLSTIPKIMECKFIIYIL